MSDEVKPRKKKKGRVIRITPDLVELIAKEQKKDESIPAVIKRLLKLDDGPYEWVLPSALYTRIEEARGAAVVRAVKEKTKKIEKPIAVRVKSDE